MDPRRIRRIHSLGPSLHCLYLSHTPVAFGHRLYNQARGGISPRSTARFTASTRSRAPSFAKMPERRTFTAISLTSSASAISRFVLPSDTRRRVSISLSEKVGEAARRVPCRRSRCRTSCRGGCASRTSQTWNAQHHPRSHPKRIRSASSNGYWRISARDQADRSVPPRKRWTRESQCEDSCAELHANILPYSRG